MNLSKLSHEKVGDLKIPGVEIVPEIVDGTVKRLEFRDDAGALLFVVKQGGTYSDSISILIPAPPPQVRATRVTAKRGPARLAMLFRYENVANREAERLRGEGFRVDTIEPAPEAGSAEIPSIFARTCMARNASSSVTLSKAPFVSLTYLCKKS